MAISGGGLGSKEGGIWHLVRGVLAPKDEAGQNAHLLQGFRDSDSDDPVRLFEHAIATASFVDMNLQTTRSFVNDFPWGFRVRRSLPKKPAGGAAACAVNQNCATFDANKEISSIPCWQSLYLLKS